jgi:hypothetical protein
MHAPVCSAEWALHTKEAPAQLRYAASLLTASTLSVCWLALATDIHQALHAWVASGAWGVPPSATWCTVPFMTLQLLLAHISIAAALSGPATEVASAFELHEAFLARLCMR